MKKTLLAIAIPAAIFANAVNAVELYNDDVNSFAIGGHVAAGITGSDQGNTEVNSVSPRINIEAKRDLGNGFVADAKAEWGINFLEGGENSLETRLGYLGLTHETYGRAVVGTQWSPYFDVAGVADMPIAFANDFLYTDHYNLGLARAEKMVSYRHGFDFAEAGALNFGLGWQGKKTKEAVTYGDRLQASVSYSIMGAQLGYAYSDGDLTVFGETVSSTTQAISASFGTYGAEGIYAAAVFGLHDYADVANMVEESHNYEAIVAYALANSLNMSLNYESSYDESNESYKMRSESAVQVEYNFLPNLVGYAAYQVDLGSDAVNHKDDNVWMMGARIYL